MSFEKQMVRTVARLARLRIEESQIEKYESELSNILSLVEQMEAVNTDGIEPMTHPFDATLRMREDIVTEVNHRDKYQESAPSTEDGLYLVPKVID